MKIVGSLLARLGLDKSKYDKNLKSAKSGAQKFGSAMKKIGAIIGAAFAIKIIARWGKAALNAYKEQRSAELKLAVIMRDRMKLGEEAFRRIVKQTGEYQKQGVIGDEIQLAGAQQLATFVKQEQALANMIPAMNNLLAQQKGYNAQAVDAVNIANMMGRVLTGQVSALSRVGISFSDVQEEILKTGTELEVTATLAQVIADNVGNMNQELAKTDLGKIQSWNMFWGDMQENLGKFIVPYLGDIAEWAKTSVPKIRDGIIDIVNTFIEWRNKSIKTRLANKMMITHMKEELIALKGKWKEVIITIVSLGKIMGHVLKGDFDKIGDEWELMGQKLALNTLQTTKDTLLLWQGYTEDIKGLGKVWKKVGKLHGEAYVDGVGDATNKGLSARPAAPGKIATGIVTPQKKPITPVSAGVVSGMFSGSLDLETTALANMEPILERNIELHNELADAMARASSEGMIIQSVANMSADAISGLGTAFGELFTDMEGGFKSVVTSMLQGVQSIINALLAQAIAGMIAKEAQKGILGLITASIGVGILTALWKSKVPEFALGGAAYGPTLAVVGEAPNISRSNPEYIGTSSQLSKMGIGGSGGKVKFIIEKDALVGVLEMYNNQKNNF